LTLVENIALQVIGWLNNQKYKRLEILKIRFKNSQYGIIEKATQQGSRYCSVEFVIHMAGDTIICM